MSTHNADAPGALPLETRLLTSHVEPSSAPSHAPTPGTTSAPLRSPTSPTLPEPDPANLTLAVSHMLNALWAAPVTPATPSAATLEAPAPALPQAAQAPVAAPRAEAPAAPQAPRAAQVDQPPRPAAPAAPQAEHPLFATPNFDALLSPGAAPQGLDAAFSLPLLAAPLAPSAPPAPSVAAAPASPAPQAMVTQLPYQLDPAVGLELPASGVGFDAHAIKAEFPILQERVHGGKQLVWLDNAATTQKPRAVIDRLSYFYEHENSNIHRAAHALAARATDAYEGARESVRRFIGAPSAREIIFVRGATEGINLVAQSWGRRFIEPGDEIIVSNLEHHANIVPWQLLCAERGARLRVAPVDDRGQILLDGYERLFNNKTRLVAFTQVSNALGTVTPAKAMIEIAQRYGVTTLLDGAQAVSHMRVDVAALGCDFFVFSGHKVFAPTGIGVVYGRSAALERMPPWQGGGNMIQDVTFERTVYQPPPARFEAGTGNIADAVGLGAALDWLSRVGIERVARHEHELLDYATAQLLAIDGLTIIGTAAEKAGVISFTLDGHSTQEIAALLDKEGIAVRGGHHCAQPILRRLGHESTVRASFAPYNTHEDVDALVDALCRIQGRG